MWAAEQSFLFAGNALYFTYGYFIMFERNFMRAISHRLTYHRPVDGKDTYLVIIHITIHTINNGAVATVVTLGQRASHDTYPQYRYGNV